MIELQELVRAHESIARQRRECVVATVVQTRGSTYRHAGARMLMAEGAQLAGAISGGCLEGDLVRKAWWRTSEGACVVRYDATIEDEDGDDIRWGFGLGCNGVIDVLLERVTPGSASDPIAFLRRCLQARQACVLATVIARSDGSEVKVGDRLMLDDRGLAGCTIDDRELADAIARDAQAALADGRSRHASYRDGTITLFIEVVLPPRALVIFGAGYDVLPLVQQAKAIGWHVTVVDNRAQPSARHRFALADRVVVAADETRLPDELELSPRAAAVVMTHNYERDRELLKLLLPSPVGYLGVLGPRARSERILTELARAGIVPSAAERARLHAPIGIDIGAEGADEIALAIVAEVQAVMARKSARSLRELHDAPASVESRMTESHVAEPITVAPRCALGGR